MVDHDPEAALRKLSDAVGGTIGVGVGTGVGAGMIASVADGVFFDISLRWVPHDQDSKDTVRIKNFIHAS
jgi:hypothetical protein